MHAICFRLANITQTDKGKPESVLISTSLDNQTTTITVKESTQGKGFGLNDLNKIKLLLQIPEFPEIFEMFLFPES